MIKKTINFKMPTTCAMLFMLMMVAAVMTWIIPAGEYDTEQVDGITRVIAGTYHTVESNPQGVWALMEAVPAGFYKSAKMLFSIMFIGGAVSILESSGSFNGVLSKLAKKNLNTPLIVFLVMLFMTIGGAAGVFSNATLALVPIGVTLALSLGYDSFTGFLIIYMGAFSGFNVGWAVNATIGVAQTIAELPMFSGMGVRVIVHIVNFLLNYAITLMYMSTVKKNPKKSLNYKEGMEISDYMGLKEEGKEEAVMSKPHLFSLIGLFVAIAALMIGCVTAGWSHDQIAAIFLTLAIYVGLINGMGINGTTKAFLNGCSKMVGAAFITGFANGIGVLLEDGRILNTIVYWLSLPLNHMGPVIGANFMFLISQFINLIIPSGSGQAAAVMPIYVPLADLAGITRQVAVQAFQFGDGLTNCLIPTAGTLMASLAIVKVEWPRYARWFLPFMILQIILAMICLTILQSIGWTGI